MSKCFYSFKSVFNTKLDLCAQNDRGSRVTNHQIIKLISTLAYQFYSICLFSPFRFLILFHSFTDDSYCKNILYFPSQNRMKQGLSNLHLNIITNLPCHGIACPIQNQLLIYADNDLVLHHIVTFIGICLHQP